MDVHRERRQQKGESAIHIEPTLIFVRSPHHDVTQGKTGFEMKLPQSINIDRGVAHSSDVQKVLRGDLVSEIVDLSLRIATMEHTFEVSQNLAELGRGTQLTFDNWMLS